MMLRYLVIDETDRMIEKGHFTEMEQILETINNEQEQAKRQQDPGHDSNSNVGHDSNNKKKNRDTNRAGRK